MLINTLISHFLSTNVQLLFDPISQQPLSMWTWLRWPAEVHTVHQNIEESCFKMLPYSQGVSRQEAPYVLSWQISFLCQISPKGFLSLPRIKQKICYSGEFVNHYTTEPSTSEQVALNVAYLLEPDVTRIFFQMNICNVYREWLKNLKISSEQQFYRWRCLFTSTRQRQMVRLEESCNSKSFVKINQGVHEAPLTVQQTTYWSRWDTTAAQKVCYRATLLPSVA